MDEMLVRAKDPGVKVYVRNKHLAGNPAETSFDLPLNEFSWWITSHNMAMTFI
jgi:hypothetical protein